MNLWLEPVEDRHCAEVARGVSAADLMSAHLGNEVASVESAIEGARSATPTAYAVVGEAGAVGMVGVTLLPVPGPRIGYVWFIVSPILRRQRIRLVRQARSVLRLLLFPEGCPPYSLLVSWIRNDRRQARFAERCGFILAPACVPVGPSRVGLIAVAAYAEAFLGE